MSRIEIGHTDNNKTVSLDLDVLLKTRLLIQANSGGGKSYALRRILEQAFAKVQCIVIDPAGEFATLREKFGYVLVGKGGETPADIRSAGMVAEKLLELRASAVCDLYALKPPERPIWVKNFLSATMNVPKKLWHPVLFVVDEAHKFCPEKGEGESEAKPEMLELASDGRKYGFCAIYATQRLAKLDKSAAAELLNVLVGPTFIDIDLERAHKALGIVRADWRDFDAQMKTITPGNFWGLGRAISTERILVKIGNIQTTHPEAGSGKHAAEPPPAPEKVKALLPKLADLPKAAEEQAQTVSSLKKEIVSLKGQLRAAPRAVAVPKEVKVVDQKAIERAVAAAVNPYQKKVKELALKLGHGVSSIQGSVSRMAEIVSGFGEFVSDLKPIVSVPEKPTVLSTSPVRSQPRLLPSTSSNGDGDSKLTGGLLKVLIAVAQYGEASHETIAVLTGYKLTSRNEFLRQLTAEGYLIRTGDKWQATQAGMDALGSSFEPLPVGDELRRYWLNRLGGGEHKIFSALVEAHPGSMDKEAIMSATGYKQTSVNEFVRLLKARRIVESADNGGQKVVDELFN